MNRSVGFRSWEVKEQTGLILFVFLNFAELLKFQNFIFPGIASNIANNLYSIIIASTLENYVEKV
ncbi:MAG: hypothetical protein JXJ22_15755 [Bacteroidales bacterium]|nr:hypothetical protein [Bacteroidales bacterium]